MKQFPSPVSVGSKCSFLALVFILTAVLAAPSQAATFTVTTATDELDMATGAVRSLREAFRDAAAAPGADTIVFAATLNGKTLTLGGEIAVSDTAGVTVDASSLPAGITLSGTSANRLLYVSGSVTLRRITLTRGDGTGTLATSLEGGTPLQFPDDDGNGGAIWNSGTMVLDRCTVSGSTAAKDGGAIFNSGTLTLTQCTLSGNSAQADGGAIANSGSLTLTQCTLSGNKAGDDGGALLHGGGTASLAQCTLAEGHATDLGGGIFVSSGVSLTLNRCIVENNTAGALPGVPSDIRNDGGTVAAEGTSVVPAFAGTAATGAGPLVGDPLPLDIGPLASNGGPTKTHALLAGNPGLDTGDGSTFTTDQRGQSLVGDPDVGAFEARAGGVFTLSATAHSVDEGNSVSITIKRTGTGPANVRLFTTVGTAAAVDFTGRPNTVASKVDFSDTESQKTISIATSTPDAPEANETFTVTLGTPSAGSTIGAPATAKVVIIDPSASSPLALTGDTAAPGIPVITAPATAARVNVDDGGTITVTGTATDNKGVKSVHAILNGGAPVLLTLANPGAPSTTFTGSVPGAISGPNTLTVVTTDFVPADPNHTKTSAVRTFKVLRPLVVESFLNRGVTAGYVPKSFREVGSVHRLTAVPPPGTVFDGWAIRSSHTPAQIGTSNLAMLKTTITFVHKEGLRLRAVFSPSPYVPGVAGTYNGGIYPESVIGGVLPSTLENQGYVTLTVQPTGAVSGSLKIDGKTVAFAGLCDSLGNVRFGTTRAGLFIPRPGWLSLYVTLKIDINGGGWLTGKVSYGGPDLEVGDVQAYRVAFSAANAVPPTAFGATVQRPAAGTYTALLGGSANALPGTIPYSYGYATVTLTPDGRVVVAAVLPDGTACTQSTTVSPSGAWTLFSQLYPGAQGLFAIRANFRHTAPGDLESFGGAWIRPSMDTQHYSAGWVTALEATMVGSKYVVPPSGSALTLTHPIGTGHGNADLAFSYAFFDPPIVTKKVDISPLDLVTKVPTSDTSYSLSITRATGQFNGTITLPGRAATTFKGVIVQKMNGGAGFFLTPTPNPKDYTGISGSVSLAPQP